MVRFRTAVTFSLTMVGAMDAYDYLFEGGHSSISLLKLVFYLVAGSFVASQGWSRRKPNIRMLSSKHA